MQKKNLPQQETTVIVETRLRSSAVRELDELYRRVYQQALDKLEGEYVNDAGRGEEEGLQFRVRQCLLDSVAQMKRVKHPKPPLWDLRKVLFL